VLLPSTLVADPDGELKRLREIFEQTHNKASPALSPAASGVSGLRQVREDLHAFRALPFAVMIYENPNVLFVVAAGDEATDNDSSLRAPSNLSRFFSNVITVAGLDEKGNLLPNSNYGVHSVSIGAAGKSIRSFAPSDFDLVLSGSSMAAAATAASRIRGAVLRRLCEPVSRM